MSLQIKSVNFRMRGLASPLEVVLSFLMFGGVVSLIAVALPSGDDGASLSVSAMGHETATGPDWGEVSSVFPVANFDFEETSYGWVTGTAPETFPEPVFGYNGSALTINPDGFFSFGFWQSGPSINTGMTMPLTQFSRIYAVRYFVSWGDLPCLAPQLRFRVTSSNLLQSEVKGVVSSDPCTYSPGSETEYTLYFMTQMYPIPQCTGCVNYSIAMDMLNFDPFDAQFSDVALEQVVVYAASPNDLVAVTPETTYTFDIHLEGWTTGIAPPLVPPEFRYFGQALTMSVRSNVLGFGFWQSPDDALTARPDELKIASFRLLSFDPPEGEPAVVRTRMFSADNQTYRYGEYRIPRGDDDLGLQGFNEFIFRLIDAPYTGNESEYGAGVAVDMLSFDPRIGVGHRLDLDEVAVETAYRLIP